MRGGCALSSTLRGSQRRSGGGANHPLSPLMCVSFFVSRAALYYMYCLHHQYIVSPYALLLLEIIIILLWNKIISYLNLILYYPPGYYYHIILHFTTEQHIELVACIRMDYYSYVVCCVIINIGHNLCVVCVCVCFRLATCGKHCCELHRRPPHPRLWLETFISHDYSTHGRNKKEIQACGQVWDRYIPRGGYVWKSQEGCKRPDRRGCRHQDTGQGKNPKAKHGRASEKRNLDHEACQAPLCCQAERGIVEQDQNFHCAWACHGWRTVRQDRRGTKVWHRNCPLLLSATHRWDDILPQ